MATTVSALIEVLEQTSPPNAKWNIKTEMPQDPEVNKKLKDLKEEGNFSEYKKLIFNILVSFSLKSNFKRRQTKEPHFSLKNVIKYKTTYTLEVSWMLKT